MPKNLFRRFTKKFFIITNIIICVLFLISCFGWWFNPAHFWFLGLLTLGSFYLLLILGVFILFWVFVKPRLSLISIITILCCYKPLQQLVAFNSSSSFKTQKQANTMRIMSWNVEHFDILEHKTHPETKEKMMELINQNEPDVAFFQEVVGAEKNEKAINYLPAIANKLNFPNYYYSYNPKLSFDGDHEFGLIIFSKYPILNKQTISNYPHDYNSIFEYVDVAKNEDTFRLFNIHLQSLKFNQTNIQYINKPTADGEQDIEKTKNIIQKLKIGFIKRKKQADAIVEEVKKSPYPVVVCGDFNDVPNSYAYSTIGNNLQNAFAKKGGGVGRTFNKISPTLRIDNIFVAKNFNVVQYKSVPNKFSDHYPVIADVELKK